VEPVNGGSRVVFRIEAAGLTGLAASLVLRFSYGRFLNRSLKRLKEALEASPASPQA